MKPLPMIWIVSDARNDADMEHALARLPRGGGLIFRHYHLAEPARRQRFDRLRRLAHARGHTIALAGDARTARRWGADAAYGSALQMASGPALPRLFTVHSLKELRRVRRARAILISPVFATRSHPGSATLGPLRFRLLAAQAPVPVIALGGMNPDAARRLGWSRWAAIDAFATKRSPRKTLDS